MPLFENGASNLITLAPGQVKIVMSQFAASSMPTVIEEAANSLQMHPLAHPIKTLRFFISQRTSRSLSPERFVFKQFLQRDFVDYAFTTF